LSARYAFKAANSSNVTVNTACTIFFIISGHPQMVFRTPSAVILLALQISAATIPAASLRWPVASADITELEARMKRRASSWFSK
jgi:hypothetical protein